ncbi:hypothetical protein ABLT94_16205, partial [Acinetobacter soli]|uniref:hypothetical protein n=1 Tax=Acinetobacter soli TaxID=487316 RepID=UPI0032B59299
GCTISFRSRFIHFEIIGLNKPYRLGLCNKATQSYRQPVYYVDLTLREGVDLQSALQTARDIDQQSKQAGFNQEALDQTARQGFANGLFEMDIEEGLDVVDEFYQEEGLHQPVVEQNTFDIQQGLKGSVTALN